LLYRSKDEISSLRDVAGTFDLPDLVTIVERLCGAVPRLKNASDPRIFFESILVDLALLDRQTDIRHLIEHLQSGAPSSGGGGRSDSGTGERTAPRKRTAGKEDGFTGRAKLHDGSRLTEPVKGAAVVSSAPDGMIPPAVPAASAEEPPDVRSSSSDPRARWNSFVTFVRQKKVSLGVCLISAKLAEFTDHMIRLEFPKGLSIQAEQVNSPDSRKFLQSMLRKYFDRDIDISCATAGDTNVASAKEEPIENASDSFNSRSSIEKQPLVKKIIEDFDGEIVSYYP
ncbi:MAG: hypothetical protein ABIA59_11590, partial [Candidatus Latescibacterota bacterium]